jgi:hypothetical protein
MKSIAQVLIAFFILALIIKLSGPNKKEIVPPVVPEGGQTTLDDTPSPPIVKPEIKDSPLLKLHNSERKSKLEIDDDLAKFAQSWAERMEKRKKMVHSNLDFPGEWNTKGENIANGYESEEDVFDGWMHSKGHRQNIKNESFTHIGIGRSGNYWCVCFGRKASAYWWEFWK